MTNATTTYHPFWLPEEIWGLIALFLDNDELTQFKQACKKFNSIGSQAIVLQPFYNRLYAIDKTLPEALPLEGAALAFKKAFESIQARQQQEMTYLTKHHPEYTEVLQGNSMTSLKSLESSNALLDKINSEIITRRININNPILVLSKSHITRLPVMLFQTEPYVNFWKKLTVLHCSNSPLATLDLQKLVALQYLYCYNNQLIRLRVQGLTKLRLLACYNNQLTALNVQGLKALQILWCHENQLTALNVQGLTALQILECYGNQLTALNVQGLVMLEKLDCDNNPLTDLNLTGVSASIKDQFTDKEKSLLFTQLRLSTSNTDKLKIIARLGHHYTYENCLYYCPVDTVKSLASDSIAQVYHLASSALSQFSVYLPSARVYSQQVPPGQEKEPGDEPKATIIYHKIHN